MVFLGGWAFLMIEVGVSHDQCTPTLPTSWQLIVPVNLHNGAQARVVGVQGWRLEGYTRLRRGGQVFDAWECHATAVRSRLAKATRCELISHNLSIGWFSQVNSPTKPSTYGSLLVKLTILWGS